MGDTFWEMRDWAISSSCERHRVYLHETWNLALTWPPYGWKSFQASISRIGRFHPYWKFGLAKFFSTISLSRVSKILTTVPYVVRRWPKRHYAAHDCIFNMRRKNRRDKRSLIMRSFMACTLQIFFGWSSEQEWDKWGMQ